MSTTNYLGLNIPDKNSKGRVVTEVFEPNFTKLDQNAEVVDRDKNSIWGGLDGGGLIEDPTVVKEVGKRYIGADGKAYICLKPSNINNLDNYMPCNVVDNLGRLQNLVDTRIAVYDLGYGVTVVENKFSYEIIVDTKSNALEDGKILNYPAGLTFERTNQIVVTYSDNASVNNNGAIRFLTNTAYTLTPINTNNIGYTYVRKSQL
ncbi:MAG: hypothetical protein ACRDDF_04325 [Aeromonas sp.]